jgi:predicted nucleic acid-binding protein
MSVELIVDTNVLVYAFDVDEGQKCTRAREVLRQLRTRGSAALTTQVLGEFYSVVVRRFPAVMSSVVAARHTAQWGSTFAVYDTSHAVVEEALRGVVRYGFSYYDAQIWACARLNQIPVILSEDFSDGATIEGVRFVNPFADGFDPHVLLG